MEFNITLLGQMFTFAIFVWVTMKYVWPFIMKALTEREETIAEGLAAAERGKHELELAKHKSTEMLRDAKIQAAEMLEQANKRAAQVIEQAKEDARTEGARLLAIAKEEIEHERNSARDNLRRETALIAIAGAEKILGRNIDESANNGMIDQLIAEVASE